MIRIGFDIPREKARALFFDRARVKQAMDKATRRVLNRFGGFVRLTARRSIRRRKAVSEPGRPPTSRTGLLRRNIWYAYDPSARSVVVGPVPIRQRSDAPAILEYGGVTKRRVIEVKNRQTGRREFRYSRNVRPRRVRYRPRPYMSPAFDLGKQRLNEFWRNSVRR